MGNAFPVGNLEEHHVMFGTADRKLSEKYGLKVMLCPEHHRTGFNAVHRNKNVNIILRMNAQEAFERKHGHDLWMKEFGRNYL